MVSDNTVSDNLASDNGSCGVGKAAHAATRVDPQQVKSERLAAALRENLKRRKAQSRSRQAQEPSAREEPSTREDRSGQV